MRPTRLPDPTWLRVGFAAPPEAAAAGKGVGIVILDDIASHPLIRHLGERLTLVEVHPDFHISCTKPAFEEFEEITSSTVHGLKALQLLTHLPYRVEGVTYVGLAPAATYIFLSAPSPDHLKRGLEWLLSKRHEWNLRIILNFLVPDTRQIGSMRPTLQDPWVQAVRPAVEAGLLVIAANGNTQAHNNLHPIDFIAVGGYNDCGLADSANHKSHPMVPWGRNGDGHMRPDILAPFTYLPVPYCEPAKSDALLSYFGGSCGAAALVTGVCACVIALFPQIELSALRSALIHGGVPLQGEPNPAPKVNASRIVEALSNHHVAPVLPTKSPIVIHDPKSSLHSDDPVERSLALTCLIDQGQCTRDRLWAFLEDTSPVVKKTAIYGLKQPINSKERDLYWHHFLQAEEHGGVKSLWCYTLLIQSTKDEINRWLPLITDENIDVRWCVQSFLHQFYKDAPSMIHTPDPDPNLIPEIAAPILEWFKLQS